MELVVKSLVIEWPGLEGELRSPDVGIFHVIMCFAIAECLDALGIGKGPWNRDLFQGLERAWREQAVTKRRVAEMAFFVRAVLQTCTHISLFS